MYQCLYTKYLYVIIVLEADEQLVFMIENI